MNPIPTTRIEYETYTLPNGLQVILSPHRVAPTVAVLALYKVGSVNEPRGETGFAHLFEHMMFKAPRMCRARCTSSMSNRTGAC
jgi:zinc protease